MKDIIESHEYDLVSAEELWDVTNEWNKEIIFDVNYIAKGSERTWGSANAPGGVWSLVRIQSPRLVEMKELSR